MEEISILKPIKLVRHYCDPYGGSFWALPERLILVAEFDNSTVWFHTGPIKLVGNDDKLIFRVRLRPYADGSIILTYQLANDKIIEADEKETKDYTKWLSTTDESDDLKTSHEGDYTNADQSFGEFEFDATGND